MGRRTVNSLPCPRPALSVVQRLPVTAIVRPLVAPKRVLAVDDNVDAAISLAELLKLDGHVTEAVHSGAAALKERGCVSIIAGSGSQGHARFQGNPRSAAPSWRRRSPTPRRGRFYLTAPEQIVQTAYPKPPVAVAFEQQMMPAAFGMTVVLG